MQKWTPTATIKTQRSLENEDQVEIRVTVSWFGPEKLDRPSTGGWVFGCTARQQDYAARLHNAINAGVVFKNARLLRDVNGKSYIEAEQTQFFHKRHMDRALRAVGF